MRVQSVECRVQSAERGVACLRLSVANLVLFLAACLLLLQPATAEEKPVPPKYKTESLRGRVVFLAESLEKNQGIKSVPEAKDRTLALQDEAGKLHPLIEDVRGRAFRVDERLRKMDVELLVRRFEVSPAVQIVRVYEVAKDGRYEIDYWCTVCSIAMYELKQCECCQGPTELRKRKAEGEKEAVGSKQ